MDKSASDAVRGANTAMNDGETATGIEGTHQTENPSTAGGSSLPAFNAEGAIGKQFKPEGTIGQIGEKVGGPLASDGMIGKQFTEQGAIGGTIHENLGKK